MDDEQLLSLIRAGGKRWESLLAKAISALLRRCITAGDASFEDVAGSLDSCLLDCLGSLRAVHATRHGRGDCNKAISETGGSIVRLSAALTELRCRALAAARPLKGS